MLRNEFIEKIKQISKENLVFIDESGIERIMLVENMDGV
ncbi:transposase [Orientia tsutsugamushi str. Gilliam]|uniref:Transposase n=1 Tax=Orientia tsutsugamushi str. Gilliam TaxID=1359184 RepID=A0A0F3M897_ORITS|nr:transposase [Orientia tsutsugamushi str. Gilliam]SPR03460.1 IS630 family transposase [Orientia tsutsugamushi str. Gilliam]